MTRLIGFICKEHGYVNVENSGGLCPKCGKGQNRNSFTGGVTHFEPAFGMEINTKDIDKLCKQHGMVYGGDDLESEARRNKKYNDDKINNDWKAELSREMDNML